jgi:peptidyl serine alpha-galactosyltransferase
MLRARETVTRHEEAQAAFGRDSGSLSMNRATEPSYRQGKPSVKWRQRRKSKCCWAILLPTLLCLFLLTYFVVLHHGTTIFLRQDPNFNPTLTTTSTETTTRHQTTLDQSGGNKTTTTSSTGCEVVAASTGSSNHDADLMDDHHKCIERDNATTSAFHNVAVAPTTTTSTSSSDNFHLVFSTGCSPFQEWQSYIFFYHVYQTGQPGNVTRIASGCTEKQVHRLQTRHDKVIRQTMSSRFHIHFTPEYSNIKGPKVQSYKFFNKPFGMQHWMEHALGYNNHHHNNNNHTRSDIPQNANPQDSVIVILLDPDQLVLRPFTNDYSNVRMEWMRRGLTAFPPKVVQHGTTMAQNYGFGADFVTDVNLTHVLQEEHPKSPLWNLKRDALTKYAAGPPYLATAKDMYRIVTKWSELVVRVHDVYPFLLAEMYAYCLATIQVGLRPLTAAGFMVSKVDYKRMSEGWYWIDDQIVPPPTRNDDNHEVSNEYLLDSYRSVCSRELQRKQEQPFVLHYCQRYGEEINGTYYISKYEMNPKFLSCDADLLREVTPHDLIRNDMDGQLISTRLRYSIRDAWMMCTLIPLFNEAAVFFKRQHCNNSSSSSSSTPTSYDKKEWFARVIVPQTKSWRSVKGK